MSDPLHAFTTVIDAEAPPGRRLAVKDNMDGQPDVRAGVLRLISTIGDVSVARSTTDGRATLTLTNTSFDNPETLIIDAGDGTPIRFLGGDPSNPTATINYEVSRVSLADF